jgi:hypothetical protein
MSYPSYSSDTPSRRHVWHNDSFYNILDIEHALKINREKRAAERQRQIEEQKVRLRIAKVAQLHSKRASVNGISEALGICKKQVEEDLDYIERSMNLPIAMHTANVNQEEKEDYMSTTDAEVDYEKKHVEIFT